MLVLSRKKSERIFINAPRSGQIEIMICDVDQGKVKIGFNAPLDFKIKREEIIDSPKDHCFAGQYDGITEEGTITHDYGSLDPCAEHIVVAQ